MAWRKQELTANFPPLSIRDVIQPHVGSMYERDRLQRMNWQLFGQPHGGEPTEFMIDLRQQVFEDF